MEVDTNSRQRVMKSIALLLFLVLAGCHSEPKITVLPSQLIGTWNSKTTSTNERSFMHWTFKPDLVYTVKDTLNACKPVDNLYYYRYSIEGNRLIMRYEGITNGLFPIPVIDRRIISVTATEIVLDTPRQVLEKCP